MTAYICKSKPRSAKFRQNPFTLKCIFSAARPIRTKINILRTKHSVSTFLAGLIRNKPCISIRFRRRVNCILYLHVYDQIFKIRFTPSLKLRGGGGEAPLFAESIEKRTVKCNALTGQLLASQNGFWLVEKEPKWVRSAPFSTGYWDGNTIITCMGHTTDAVLRARKRHGIFWPIRHRYLDNQKISFSTFIRGWRVFSGVKVVWVDFMVNFWDGVVYQAIASPSCALAHSHFLL